MLKTAATLVAITAGLIGFGLVGYAFLSRNLDPKSPRGRAVRAAAATGLIIMVAGVGTAAFAPTD
ncbi:hypothetical protein [Cellulomonas sp. C5510]|uniref:hypothetical protein n=1 Tax=Cellulomonas sp. C5510 TaxID=2871170 RepID=UPI001C93A6C9|nr:hypothetical protein [Cellulomonas sp. C5510]QZN85183.1 hypothetical protein K5O09_15585 [Cellulomonas sp. C5510]